jgi:anti-sigma B factor antagonist
MEKPRIKVSYKSGIKVIELLDEKILDEISIHELTETLFSTLSDNGATNMVINFANVMQMSSSMLGTLIRLNKRVAEKGGDLKLCCVIPMLYEIFAITKINKLFEIYDDEQTAINSFA